MQKSAKPAVWVADSKDIQFSNALLIPVDEAMNENHEPRNPSILWQKYFNAGHEARRRGAYSAAEKLFRAALKKAETFGAHDVRLHQSLSTLAAFYHREGNLKYATVLYERSMEHQIHSVGLRDPYIIPILNSVALIYSEQSKYEESTKLLNHALELSTDHQKEQSAMLVTTLKNLAHIFMLQRKYNEAEPYLRRALVQSEQATDDNQSTYVSLLEMYADLLRRSDRYSESVIFRNQARKLRNGEALPEKTQDAASVALDLALSTGSLS